MFNQRNTRSACILQPAAQRAAAAPPLTSEEARQQSAERLTLLVADNKAGYFAVHHQPGKPKPYQARVTRSGKGVHLGCFATAEEAALCVARSPEGQAAAQKAAATTRPLTSEEEGVGSFVKKKGMVSPMPPDAYVKERPDSRPKRRRTK